MSKNTIVDRLSEKNIHIFLEQNKITDDQGNVLDFYSHEYLWDIFDDFSPRLAILKAAQICMSTTIMHKALWASKNIGLDIIYTLPSSSDIRELISAKMNRLIANNPIYQEWTADKDSIDQKKIGNSIMYFRGTWTERAAIAIPADLYISDETDRSKQEIVTQYKTRLQHSKFGWEWYLSNPSAPGVGVDKHWLASDQKHWFIKCEHCNFEWYLTMENIMGTPPYFGCTKCRKELDRHHGRWVKKYSGRESSGYWISLLMPPRTSAKYILTKKEELSEEQFDNYVLGVPYIGKGNTLTKQMFMQNLTDAVNPQTGRTIIGVDTGKEINYVIGNKHGLFHYGKCPDYGQLENFMQRWPNAIMIIDQGGDIIGPRKLREKFKGRVFLCFFRADRKNDKLIDWNDSDGTVVADRNKLIQLSIDEFTEKRIPMAGSETDWYDFYQEWAGMYRTQEESSIGTPIFKWNKPSTGRCDYPFSHVYWRIGMDRFNEESSTFHIAGSQFASDGMDSLANDTTLFKPKF